MKPYMKKPIFWLAFGVFSLLSAIASSYLFPKAFSIVNLSVTMNRTQALDRAQELAEQYKLGPEKYQQAIIFYLNNNVKTYTELEAGGKEAFDNLIAQNLFQP